MAPNYVDALFNLGLVLRAHNQLSEAVGPLRQAAEGGSREAQGLLASMYMNGNGIDRNVPLAMLWWARSVAIKIWPTYIETIPMMTSTVSISMSVNPCSFFAIDFNALTVKPDT